MFEGQSSSLPNLPSESEPKEEAKIEKKPTVNLPEANPYYYQPGELAEEMMKRGGLKKNIIIIFLLLIILSGLAFGGYLVYQRLFSSQGEEAALTNSEENMNTTVTNTTNTPPVNTSDQNTNAGEDIVSNFTKILCYVSQNPSAANYFAEGLIRDTVNEEISSLKEGTCNLYTNSEINEVFPLIITDEDADGVNLIYEELFGSDDANKDSDGDGYDDLTEINGGYDPAGPGKLE